MDNNIKTIIKITGIILCLIILIVMSYFVFKMNAANVEEQTTPVIIPPAKQKIIQEKTPSQSKPVIKKPLMRDENDMPKSDYKVPEIG